MYQKPIKTIAMFILDMLILAVAFVAIMTFLGYRLEKEREAVTVRYDDDFEELFHDREGTL